MTEPSLQQHIQAIGADGYITANEVLTLRRSVFADGIVSSQELDALFALGDRAPNGDPQWAEFFAEAATDFYLREEEPQGYLTDEEFNRLKARATRNSRDISPLEIALFLRLLEKARTTPKAMAAFTGAQIKRSILQKPEGAFVSREDAGIVRRYLFAAGGDGSIAVTRDEAELLFDINDAADSARNHDAWTELFVQGVINHLSAHLGYRPPSREEAFRRHAWVNDHSSSVGGFFKRMVSGGIGAVKDAYQEPSLRAAHESKREKDAAAATEVTPEEAGWLADRIGRDGKFDETEQRLIAQMRDMEEELPETLKALVGRAA